jgi:hypothetical protein
MEAERSLPDTTSAAAEEGTRAHELLERLLLGQNPEGHEGAEMVGYVMQAVRWVESWTDKGYKLLVEQAVDPKWLFNDADCWGTGDIILYTPGHLIIADFKYGYTEVQAEDNPQLIAYAVGALDLKGLPPVESIKEVTMAILQPRLFGGATVKSVTVPTADLLDIAQSIALSLAGNREPDAPRYPEEKACVFCKAKLNCPERLQSALDNTAALFNAALMPEEAKEVSEIYTDMGIAGMDVQELANLADLTAMLTAVFNDIDGEIVERIHQGIDVPGYKLIRGQGSRKWNLSEEELHRKFKNLGIPKSHYMVVKMGHPNLLEKFEPLSDAKRENLANLWTSSKGNEKLVTSSTPGDPIEYNTAKIFKDYAGSESEQKDDDIQPEIVDVSQLSFL